MSWSIELWDQFETVTSHTSKGIDFLDKLGQFFKDRCIIETDYAKSLRKLSKNYDLKKKDDEKEFTYSKAFGQMLKEISDMAGQHEVIAENITTRIVEEIALVAKNLREEKKKHLKEGERYQSLLSSSLNQLDKSKKYYDKAFKESEKAHEQYQKADKDLHLSRADLEKAKTLSLTKERACENSKTNYAKQLQVANEAQKEHYTQLMPNVFQKLQDLEKKRIEEAQKFIELSANVHRDVIPIMNTCLQGIIDASKSIDPNIDARLVIDRYKSGMQPPDDIPFEDLSAKVNNCETESTQSKGSSLAYSHSLKSDSLRHTFTARGFKKRTRLLGIFGAKNDYSELPPNQRRKKIQSKIDQLNTQISQANGVKDGLIIMRQAYEENGAFGDPKTIESQIRETESNLDRLQNELTKNLVLRDEIDATRNDNKNNSNSDNEMNKSPSISNSNHRTSIGPESELSRTNSDNSLRPDSNNRDVTKSSATNRTSNSFNDSLSESNSNNAISTSQSDAVDGPRQTQNENGANHVENAQEPSEDSVNETLSDLPAQAHARALYPFKSDPAGSISMVENEVFDVIEFDQGDGWTRVRRKIHSPDDADFIGFVPTSYISIDTNSH